MEETEKLKPRLQFLVTIALFFPIILEYLFKQGGTSDLEVNKMILLWGLEIAILICCYILLECTKRWESQKIFNLTNCFLFVNMFSFSVVLFIFAAMQNTGYISYIYLYVFGTAFPSVLAIPTILFILLTVNIFLPENKKNWVYHKI